MSERPIYLDHAATSPPLPEVVEAVGRTMCDVFGNPSSAHPFGERARRVLDDALEFLRGTLGAQRVVLTSGGTESDLLGVVGAARCRPPGRVLVGAADHAAVLGLDELLRSSGHRTTRVPVTEHGDLDPEQLFELLGKDVRVVSILHGHNELGTLARVEELAGVVRHTAPEAHVHVDLVQAYGKVPFDLDEAGVDSVAVSGHKLHGPRGVGLLALSSKARIVPVQAGGGQQQGLRGGTENVPGAVGLMVAAEAAFSHLSETAEHTEQLARRAFAGLRAVFPRAERLGHPERRLPHVLSVRLPGVNAQSLQQRCAARGLAFATGSACHDRGEGPSHVLAAIGLGKRASREVFRLSFARTSTVEEVDAAVGVLVEEARALRSVSV